MRLNRTANTQITAYPRALMETPAVSLARTASSHSPRRTQLSASAARRTWSAMASVWPPARAPLAAFPPSKSAGSGAALAQRGLAGMPAGCLVEVREHGSASIPHGIWRAVSVPVLASIPACHSFNYLRWRMRASPDALLANRPGLHRYPRCCGRRLSLWRM